MAKEDNSWRGLESWERVQWARRHWQETNGGGSKRDAAISLGMQENTYSAYERAPDSSKHTALSHSKAVEFARKFKVRWEWLLAGDKEGEPWLPENRPKTPKDRLLKAIEEAEADDPVELERKAQAIVTLLRGAKAR